MANSKKTCCPSCKKEFAFSLNATYNCSNCGIRFYVKGFETKSYKSSYQNPDRKKPKPKTSYGDKGFIICLIFLPYLCWISALLLAWSPFSSLVFVLIVLAILSSLIQIPISIALIAEQKWGLGFFSVLNLLFIASIIIFQVLWYES